MTHYSDGQKLPTPNGIDFKPGELLGSVSGALGLKDYCKREGHELIVTSSKEGANSELDQHLPDARSSSRSRSGRPT